jgi:hypothetical protein
VLLCGRAEATEPLAHLGIGLPNSWAPLSGAHAGREGSAAGEEGVTQPRDVPLILRRHAEQLRTEVRRRHALGVLGDLRHRGRQRGRCREAPRATSDGGPDGGR